MKTGNWIFRLTDNNETMGYWPKEIFTSLADSADYIEWGGEVYSPSGITPPPMGAGHWPTRKLYDNCYGTILTVINENHEMEHNPQSCSPFITSDKYILIDGGYLSPLMGRVIFFGGK